MRRILAAPRAAAPRFGAGIEDSRRTQSSPLYQTLRPRDGRTPEGSRPLGPIASIPATPARLLCTPWSATVPRHGLGSCLFSPSPGRDGHPPSVSGGGWPSYVVPVGPPHAAAERDALCSPLGRVRVRSRPRGGVGRVRVTSGERNFRSQASLPPSPPPSVGTAEACGPG